MTAREKLTDEEAHEIHMKLYKHKVKVSLPEHPLFEEKTFMIIATGKARRNERDAEWGSNLSTIKDIETDKVYTVDPRDLYKAE